MARRYDLTAVGINPAADRAHRMKVYFIAMSIRLLCVASLFFVRGWWILLAAAGAVLLPYFAVLIANQAEQRGATRPEQPGPLELMSTSSADGDDKATSVAETVVVVDAPAERRGGARRSDGPPSHTPASESHQPSEAPPSAAPPSETADRNHVDVQGADHEVQE